MIKKVSKLLFITLAFLALPLVLGLGCKKSSIAPTKQITLRYWSVFNDSDFFTPIIQAYQQQNPNIKIEYKKLDYEEYETEVLNALAAGRGPDIWSVYHTWYPNHLDKLAPIPKNLLTAKDFEEVFVGVASDELIFDQDIYGLPLAIDNLVLFYNQDIFNNAGIVKPPTTWVDLMSTAEQITDLDGDIINLSGVALGTADNVNRAVDILAALMLQSGSGIIEPKAKSSSLLKTIKDDNTGKAINPALNALSFYTDFANPRKSSYSWNTKQDYSLDAFSLGKTAMMINYSYHIPTIKLKAPNLNFKVAALPQVDKLQKINYPSYWAESVSATSQNVEEAWRFLIFLASKSGNKLYTDKSGKASARRDIIATQQEKADLGIVATQNLSAKSWYRGGQQIAIEEVFASMIRDVNLGRKDTDQALRDAHNAVNNILQGKD